MTDKTDQTEQPRAVSDSAKIDDYIAQVPKNENQGHKNKIGAIRLRLMLGAKA